MESVPIVFTLGDLVWLCGAVMAVAAVVSLAIRAFTVMREPNNEQNKRLDAIEWEIEEFKKFFNNDDTRIKAIEDGNRVTQQALLALMGHAINGNDIANLKRAKEDLEHYLVSK